MWSSRRPAEAHRRSRPGLRRRPSRSDRGQEHRPADRADSHLDHHCRPDRHQPPRGGLRARPRRGGDGALRPHRGRRAPARVRDDGRDRRLAARGGSLCLERGAMVLVPAPLLAAVLGWLLAEMLVAMLTHVFDPPPDHLAMPWGFLALLYGVAILAGIGGSLLASGSIAGLPPRPRLARALTPGILGLMLPRVLVIEDDADLRRLLRRGLEEEGFEVSRRPRPGRRRARRGGPAGPARRRHRPARRGRTRRARRSARAESTRRCFS